MTPATSTQPQHSSGRRNCDMFSRYPRPSISANNAGVTVAVPASSEIVVEIATPGARPPLHFAKESSAFHRYSRSNECERGPATRHHEAPSARWQSMPVAALGSSARGLSCTPQKHHRRTSTPLDGVCFTLLGVSTGLKTPGVNHWSVATALVESSVDLRTRNAKGMTPLHLACAAGQVDVAKVLLLAGADPHARDHRSRCPLHMAALAGSKELAKALLTCGADPSKASDLGTTALHNAALLGRVEVSRALLVAGANADATDHNSFSPLYLAAQNGHTQVVLDLLAAGADPDMKTSRGFTALHVAARCGRLTVLRALLDAGLPVDCSSTPAETTPLHLSAGFSREACVEELLKRGADPSKHNRRGVTPLDIVGTLLPPGAKDAPSGSPAEAALEKRAGQGKRVRTALVLAQKWQRRRAAVLLFEALRSRAAASVAAASTAAGAVEGIEERPGATSSKRCRRSMDGADGAEMRGALGSGEFGCAVGSDGWVFEQLSAHANPVLIRNVIRFL